MAVPQDIKVPCPMPECEWYVQGRQDSGVGEKMAQKLEQHLAAAHGLGD